MDILGIMDIAAEIEERAALLYHTYSRRFHDNPQGYAFWEQISHDEKRHADMVRIFRRQRLQLPPVWKLHADFTREMESARLFVLRQLKAEPVETVGKALDVAGGLEEIMSHAHLDHINEAGDPLLTKLFINLGSEDRRHQERIRQMSQIFPLD